MNYTSSANPAKQTLRTQRPAPPLLASYPRLRITDNFEGSAAIGMPFLRAIELFEHCSERRLRRCKGCFVWEFGREERQPLFVW